MLHKVITPAVVAALAALLMPSEVDAWGAAHTGYTFAGPGGVYHTERTAVGGPGGVYTGSRTTAVGAPGGGVYRYSYGHAGGVGIGGGGSGYIPEREGLCGPYVTQGGAPCSVRRDGDSYVFTNEQGSWARFVSAGPNRLEQVDGQWNRSTTCTVIRDDQGRLVLRFDTPNEPPGYWTPGG
jgi:hypothetical protein